MVEHRSYKSGVEGSNPSRPTKWEKKIHHLFLNIKIGKAKKAVRRVRPIELWYGKTEWHPEEQWLLKAWDLDKDAERNFAWKDIIHEKEE